MPSAGNGYRLPAYCPILITTAPSVNFFKTPPLLKYLYPGLVWDKKQEAKDCSTPTLYITFDDGPVPEVTPFVWDTLTQFDALATFFCVGENVSRYPQLYQETLYRQHAVGNHTHHHLNGWRTDDATYLDNVAACAQALRTHNPSRPSSSLFRPPYGKIRRRQIKALKAHYTLVMWDILSGDFDATFDARVCLQKSIRHTQPGTIIIFHDSYKAQKNLAYVLPRYLEHFARAGYTFSPL